MISVKQSKIEQSAIVTMGDRLNKAVRESGQDYLMLNRGINSVVPIDLNAVIKNIDFNSDSIQVYQASKGTLNLRNAINQEYFNENANVNHILVTAGGISGLDIVFQTIDCDEILLPPLFWGTYTQILTLRGIKYQSYTSYNDLLQMSNSVRNKAIIICDPGNPLGEKTDDQELLDIIRFLDKNGAYVIFDCPYRRLFYDCSDRFYQEIYQLENVVIVESFSKSLGLSGQRIGFIYNNQPEFTNEAALRLSFATNGINGFAQSLVSELLISDEGKKVVANFKSETVKHINLNIDFLKRNNLLASELYDKSKPIGIFAVVSKTSEDLFQNRIGSIGLDYFTLNNKAYYEKYSRILVAINHDKFVSYFRNLT